MHIAGLCFGGWVVSLAVLVPAQQPGGGAPGTSTGATAVAKPIAEEQGHYYVDAAGVALDGYDVVAYFEAAAPVRGSADHEAVFDGEHYRFATAEHRARFVDDPAQFLPRYGGWCAFAIGMPAGQAASVPSRRAPDPTSFEVSGGRLYLFASADSEAKAKWAADRAALRQRADLAWLEVVRQTHAGARGKPNPFGPPQLAQFQFVIGDWDVAVDLRTPNGWTRYAARWTNTWIADGFAVHQRWDGPYVKGSEFRAWDAAAGHWSGHNIYSGKGWSDTTGKFTDGCMVIVIEGGWDTRGSFQNRETYSEIGADAFRVVSELSYDDGETWETGNYVLNATRRE